MPRPILPSSPATPSECLIDNDLSDYIKFPFDAVSSGVAFNVDVDVTLTVTAGRPPQAAGS